MKNIEYLLAKTEIPQFDMDSIGEILVKECEINGREKQLSRCMEELAEVIELLAEYQISGKINIISLMEELCDCYIETIVMDIIFDNLLIPESDDYYEYDNRNAVISNCILNLATAITKISKCIRAKKDSDIPMLGIRECIHETIYNIMNYFDIRKDSDINTFEKIFALKIQRTKDRNDSALKKLNSEPDVSE